VKILADEQMQAGTRQLTWNAKDEKGKIVNAGIYFLKMQTGSYTVTRKLVVVK
jgi:flagellar hook assembly protein FlgD